MQFGFDLGRTKTEIAVLDDAGEIVLRHRQATPGDSYPLILKTIQQLLDQACASLGTAKPDCVGIGIPGCLDVHTQLVRGSNTQVMNHQPLQDDLQHLLGCEVRLQNDANCLALSEAVDGAGAGCNVVFAVILGTGCGGGIVVNRQLLTGRHAIAGEWGHNPLPWPTADELQVPPCWCGQTGCHETWLSGPAFAQDHLRHTGQTMHAPDIVHAMREGDDLASASFDRYVNRLGRALAQVINLLDPDAVVLGGGMSNVQELYPRLGGIIARYSFGVKAFTPVRRAVHGDSSGVRGAAWLCR
ncbi:MAG: ROK family protein [Limnohabitans sp.]|nr:ROK family protein [Limnohabitans sp.]